MRVGKLEIHSDLARPENVMKLCDAFGLLKFLPIRVEHVFYGNRFEMLGFSPLFADIEEGRIAPTYSLDVSEDDHGNVIDVAVNHVDGT